mmetsp:Transcript_23283/g.47086  ORF Transcript_23283/g.47086 Transcript_23283/m.47086 type:complete len:218 (+) Transcript_23283:878-1531(+)
MSCFSFSVSLVAFCISAFAFATSAASSALSSAVFFPSSTACCSVARSAVRALFLRCASSSCFFSMSLSFNSVDSPSWASFACVKVVFNAASCSSSSEIHCCSFFCMVSTLSAMVLSCVASARYIFDHRSIACSTISPTCSTFTAFFISTKSSKRARRSAIFSDAMRLSVTFFCWLGLLAGDISRVTMDPGTSDPRKCVATSSALTECPSTLMIVSPF